MEALEHRRLLTSAAVADIFTYHDDAGEDGQDLNETVLTPSNVNSSDFGKVWTTTLDGQVYAQPLSVANVNITRGSEQGIHDVIYVATMHDSLFAIDANSGAILWQDNFTQIVNPEVTTLLDPVPTTGVTTIPNNSSQPYLVNTSDIGPELGILTTPAIDPSTGVIFLNAATMEIRGSNRDFVQRLWAINESNGAVAVTPTNPSYEPASDGVVVGDTIMNGTISSSNYTGYEYVAGPYVQGTGNNGPGTATGDTLNNNADGWAENPGDSTTIFKGTFPSAKDYIAFNALLQMNRVAVTLVNGVAYLGFASHGDDGPYYGWILAYNESNLQNVVAWVSVPDYEPFGVVSGDRSDFDAQAGFWGSGGGFTTDGTYLYVASGNGAFNPNTSNFSSTFTSTDVGSGNAQHTVQMPLDDDYGDAVIKLQYDPNASQSNVNVAGGVINDPNGTYAPDNGYDSNGFGLKVVDFFTPSNVVEMNGGDEDLGSSGILLIPTTGAGAMTAPDGDAMLTAAGKEGRLYVIDADNLGGYNTAYITDGYEETNEDPSGFDRVLGEFYYYEYLNPGTDANNESYKGYDTQTYFDGEVYLGLGTGNVPEMAFKLSSLIAGTVPPNTGVGASPVFTSTTDDGSRGATATVSANPSMGNGVLWLNLITQSTSNDALAAFSATATGTVSPIYQSGANVLSGGASGATGVKFSVPTVFNGMVYDGTGGGSGTSGHIEGNLDGFGLLSSYLTSTGFSAPTGLNASNNGDNDVHLSWTLHSPNADVVEIDRSSNGGATWAVLAYLANGSLTYDDTTVASGTTYEYRVQAVGGPTLSGYSGTAGITTVVVPSGPTLLSAVSRKLQGSTVYDIPITLSGSATSVEDRTGGPTQLVLIFNSVIAQGSGFNITLSSGTVGSFTMVGPILTINLSGTTNGTILTANINNLEALGGAVEGNYALNLGVLFGDVNGDGTVNSTDVSLAQSVEGDSVNGQNYRADVDCTGAINSTDVSDISGGAGISDVESIGPVITLPPPTETDSTPITPSDVTDEPSNDDSSDPGVSDPPAPADPVTPTPTTVVVVENPAPPSPPDVNLASSTESNLSGTANPPATDLPTTTPTTPPPTSAPPDACESIFSASIPPTAPIAVAQIPSPKPANSISVKTAVPNHVTPSHLAMSWQAGPAGNVFASSPLDSDPNFDDLLKKLGKSVLK
jgi:hypothetical protein